MPDVYILQSLVNKKYYIGSTLALQKRLKHHSGGHTHSTKRLGKMELVFKQSYSTLKDARSIEKKLKRFKRKDYIEKIIEEGYIKMNP